jgi:hypothetical protein
MASDIKEFEVKFKIKSPIATLADEFLFKKYKIIFSKKEGRVEYLKILINAETSNGAREEAKKIIENLNNLCCYNKNFLLAEDDSFEVNDPTGHKSTIMKTLSISYAVISPIDFKKGMGLEIYNQCKDIKKLDELLAMFENSVRIKDKEFKFLCYYKIINSLGEGNHTQINEWLKSKFKLGYEERKRRDNGVILKNTWPVNLRHAIMYDENPDISDEQLKNMEIFAKTFISEKYFQFE